MSSHLLSGLKGLKIELPQQDIPVVAAVQYLELGALIRNRLQPEMKGYRVEVAELYHRVTKPAPL